MSQTAEFTITRAFSIAKIKKDNIDIEPNEMNDGISTYNNLIAQLQIDGVTFGASKVDDKEDDTEVPDWAQEMIETQIAIRLADEFNRPVTSVLAARTSRALKAVMRMVRRQRQSAFPNTLPVGSGNYSIFGRTSKFFPDRDCGDIRSANNDFMLDDQGQVIQNEDSCGGSNSSFGDSNG